MTDDRPTSYRVPISPGGPYGDSQRNGHLGERVVDCMMTIGLMFGAGGPVNHTTGAVTQAALSPLSGTVLL